MSWAQSVLMASWLENKGFVSRSLLAIFKAPKSNLKWPVGVVAFILLLPELAGLAGHIPWAQLRLIYLLGFPSQKTKATEDVAIASAPFHSLDAASAAQSQAHISPVLLTLLTCSTPSAQQTLIVTLQGQLVEHVYCGLDV
eukprot:1137690-Pelagomonas_calceolata.AAC.4